jgi:hypothetical protein
MAAVPCADGHIPFVAIPYPSPALIMPAKTICRQGGVAVILGSLLLPASAVLFPSLWPVGERLRDGILRNVAAIVGFRAVARATILVGIRPVVCGSDGVWGGVAMQAERRNPPGRRIRDLPSGRLGTAEHGCTPRFKMHGDENQTLL